jgi:hypothetical protein
MLGSAAHKGRSGGDGRNRRMLVGKIMLIAVGALVFGLAGPALASPAPANALAIGQAVGTISPATRARCSIKRWCGPTKCHRRLWCR